MKKFAKVIRIITVAPILAFTLINILYFLVPGSFNGILDYLIAIFTLVIMPILAYPVQRKFRIIKGDPRTSERQLAIVFSVIGYSIGIVAALMLNVPYIEKLIYSTYLISGVSIAILSAVFKVEASGHMCGVSGPIAILIYLFGIEFLFLLLFPVAVIWSSLVLKRHTVPQLLLGASIPIMTFLILIVI